MNVSKKLSMIFLWAILLILAGCEREEVPEITESQVWETMPELTYGVMECEKLETLPWYSGRVEAVSRNRYAETEKGFYTWNEQLTYMDKDNPEVWVPVCNKINCTHPPHSTSCNAYAGYGHVVVIRDGRIYICTMKHFFPELLPLDTGGHKSDVSGFALFSKALNGEDMRLEYVLDESLVTGFRGCVNLLSSRQWLYNVTTMDQKGCLTTTSYCLTGEELRVLAQFEAEEMGDGLYLWESPFEGDFVFYNYAMGNMLYGIKSGDIYEIDPGIYTNAGGYLSGHILRQFRTGDGYYDIDLETGEERFLTSARLENSTAKILLPNCIVETTLGSVTHPEGEEHAMEVFDGECWRTVILPEELKYAGDVEYFSIDAIASDRILFACAGENGDYRYQVMLGQDALVMEAFGRMY